MDANLNPQSDPQSDGSLSKMPTVIVVLGMAGSGKTTFMCRLYSKLRSKTENTTTSTTTSDPTDTTSDDTTGNPTASKAPFPGRRVYTINLDPAVNTVPFPCNIDIRDTVNYKDVMKRYNLGPNGGTMTCLNLFATRFHTALELVEKRAPHLDYIIIDTPGQIEVFNWSASGTIILEYLASMFPITICYIIDTVRCDRAITFMSNMLYACSVLYKTRMPFIACFNKIDVCSHETCLEWMTNYDAFADAVTMDQTYMASFSRSCGLALAEFYENLKAVGVSAATGQGFDEFLKAVDECREEYNQEYLPWVKDIIKKKKEKEAQKEEATGKKEFENFEADYDGEPLPRMANVTLTPNDSFAVRPEKQATPNKTLNTSQKVQQISTIPEEKESDLDDVSEFKMVDR